jgi:hypothetical protein
VYETATMRLSKNLDRNLRMKVNISVSEEMK